MKVSSTALLKTVHNSKSYSATSVAKKLKSLKDGKIVGILKNVLAHKEIQNSNVWMLAGAAFNELSIRVWGKTHRKALETFRRRLITKSDLCVARRSYAMETAGLLDKKTKKIYHPYPFEALARSIFDEWNNSNTKKSLQDYIGANIDYDEVQQLKNNRVHYLADDSLKKYKVKFSHGYPKIGNKTLRNGEYMFTLARVNDKAVLYAGIKKKGKFQHTSFSAGAPVLCPGVFEIRKKKLSKIKLSSGHYHPTKAHAVALKAFFKDSGVGKVKIQEHKK